MLQTYALTQYTVIHNTQINLRTVKGAQWDQTQSRELLGLFICVCIALCTIVAYNTAQNRPDNFPSYPPDNHQSNLTHSLVTIIVWYSPWRTLAAQCWLEPVWTCGTDSMWACDCRLAPHSALRSSVHDSTPACWWHTTHLGLCVTGPLFRVTAGQAKSPPKTPPG